MFDLHMRTSRSTLLLWSPADGLHRFVPFSVVAATICNAMMTRGHIMSCQHRRADTVPTVVDLDRHGTYTKVVSASNCCFVFLQVLSHLCKNGRFVLCVKTGNVTVRSSSFTTLLYLGTTSSFQVDVQRCHARSFDFTLMRIFV